MKISEFKSIYEQAKNINIVSSDFFNCAGWFWINLTETQHTKMYDLMVTQGAKETIHVNGKKIIYLENGLGVWKY
jgi:hypothetical protein